MSKFIDKFNIFDLFTMLIPGIVFLCSIGIALSSQYYQYWDEWSNEKYVLFFVFSYIFGICLQEIGTICDKGFLHKILYGGYQRQVFLLDNKWHKIFDERITFEIAKKIKQKIVNELDLEEEVLETEENVNSFVFAYCISFLETNELNGKPDKMVVLSEMSRSFMYSSIFTLFIILVQSVKGYMNNVLATETFIMIILGAIFFLRKCRYEKYRLRIMIRKMWILYQKDL